MDAPTTVVRTVGHASRPLEEFLRLLRAHRVTLVVDVRKMPGSRHNPQFNRDALSNALHEAGIGYVHLPGARRLAPSHAELTEHRLEERLVPGVRRLHVDA